MGKLHKIKRQILRNPEDWYSVYPGTKKPWVAKGVGILHKGKFKPDNHFLSSYRNFVKSVLKSIGIETR